MEEREERLNGESREAFHLWRGAIASAIRLDDNAADREDACQLVMLSGLIFIRSRYPPPPSFSYLSIGDHTGSRASPSPNSRRTSGAQRARIEENREGADAPRNVCGPLREPRSKKKKKWGDFVEGAANQKSTSILRRETVDSCLWVSIDGA